MEKLQTMCVFSVLVLASVVIGCKKDKAREGMMTDSAAAPAPAPALSDSPAPPTSSVGDSGVAAHRDSSDVVILPRSGDTSVITGRQPVDSADGSARYATAAANPMDSVRVPVNTAIADSVARVRHDTTHSNVVAHPGMVNSMTAAARLTRARLLFDCPVTMHVGDEYYATAEFSDDVARVTVRQRSSTRDTSRVDAIVPVARRMSAALKGSPEDFAIHLTGGDSVCLMDDRFDRRWEWSIIPLREGENRRLHLMLYAEVPGSNDRGIRTFDHIVTVGITPWRRFTRFAESQTVLTIAGSIMVPLLIAFPFWRRRQAKSSPKDAAEQ